MAHLSAQQIAVRLERLGKEISQNLREKQEIERKLRALTKDFVITGHDNGYTNADLAEMAHTTSEAVRQWGERVGSLSPLSFKSRGKPGSAA